MYRTAEKPAHRPSPWWQFVQTFQMPSNFERLPPELLLSLACDLSAADILHLVLSCRRLHGIFFAKLYKVGSNPLRALLWMAESGRLDMVRYIPHPSQLILSLDLWSSNNETKLEPRLLEQINALATSREFDPMTPLVLAVQEGHEKVVTFLLNEGANPDIRDRSSAETPLAAAAYNNRPKQGQLLLAENINPNTMNGLHTPLDFAVERGYGAVVRVLLRNQARLSWTYHFALLSGHIVLETRIKKLLDNTVLKERQL